jgi:hypothetical protein
MTSRKASRRVVDAAAIVRLGYAAPFNIGWWAVDSWKVL